MDEKIETIKYWLRTGSINIFGLPMSGKDTVGVRLAEVLGGKFLSSGMIIRAMEQETKQNLTSEGKLIETNMFYDWVLPYFERRDLEEFPLILSSVGRWSGEENQVLSVAESAGHPIKAVILLNISEGDVMSRWEAAQILNDRGDRLDDKESAVFKTRINEFVEKTIPVLKHYREMGLLVEVKADMDRESVFNETIEQLYQFAENSRVVV
jgi:adenylate kinase family enzyme